MISENLEEDYKITDLDMKNFDQYLIDYQLDITKLLQSKRKSTHKLSIEEIVSDFNLNLLKNRERIIKWRSEEFTEFSKKSFHFLMCVFAKNMVFWLDYRERKRPYVSKRVDNTKYINSQPHSTFDFVSMYLGEEDSIDFDESDKFIMTVNHIKNYYDWFTKTEIELIDLLMSDLNQLEISKIRNCTHQAISASVKALKEKIQNRIKYDISNDDSWHFIQKGNESINNLFSYKIKS